MYASSLQQVNASIADAKKTVTENPEDADARQLLRQAYRQKAMLYELAARSLR
jgi:hypothetical protein